jgi:CBS-domain-containing membrane protein
MRVGPAWRLTPGSAAYLEVSVDAERVARAKYLYFRQQVAGQSAVIFELDGILYAQLDPERLPKSQKAARAAVVATPPKIASSEPVQRKSKGRKCGPRGELVIL